MFSVGSYVIKSDGLAFLTFNLAYEQKFIDQLIGTADSDEQTKKSKLKGIDSKLGLHDYFVYFCIRNQTKDIFVSHTVNIYKGEIEFCKKTSNLIVQFKK